MKPYYQDEFVTLYHGDSDGTFGGTGVLSALEGPFDAVITDPPYNVSGGDRSGREGTTLGTLKRKDGTARKVQRDFGTWDRTWMPNVFLSETTRLLREGGSLIAFTSEFLIGDYMASGLNHRNLIYWRKSNPTPAFRKLYVRAVEMAVWQVKGKGGWTWNSGGYTVNVLEGPIVMGSGRVVREHPTQKPLWLMSRIIEQHTNEGDLILDPYAGSGTTAIAAKQMGRRVVVIEQDEAFCEVTAKRLSQGVLDFGNAS